MNIEIRNLKDLKYAEYNPRKALTEEDPEYQNIARSIKEFGYVDPIIINSDNTIIGGHQRVTVMRDMGYTEAQAVVVDLPKDKERALNIALNKITGQWDDDKLLLVLRELQAADYDISLTGFNPDEVADLMRRCGTDELVDDDFDAEAAYDEIEEPVARRGDIWLLGGHRLMCGDATEAADAMALMRENTAQLIVTDPPYNVDYEGEAGKILNDHMGAEAFYNFLLAAFKNMLRFADPGAAVYVFHADTEGYTFRRAFADAGFDLHQVLIWVKNSFVLGRQDYHWQHEPVLYGWKPGAAHYFIADRTQSTVYDRTHRPDFKAMKKEQLLELLTAIYDDADGEPRSIIYCDRPVKSDEHPTMKPVPLLGLLIGNSSRPGEIVTDFFGGSGSTLIACEQLGRNCYMMDLDPKNVDVIIKRWETLTGKTAFRI